MRENFNKEEIRKALKAGSSLEDIINDYTREVEQVEKEIAEERRIAEAKALARAAAEAAAKKAQAKSLADMVNRIYEKESLKTPAPKAKTLKDYENDLLKAMDNYVEALLGGSMSDEEKRAMNSRMRAELSMLASIVGMR